MTPQHMYGCQWCLTGFLDKIRLLVLPFLPYVYVHSVKFLLSPVQTCPHTPSLSRAFVSAMAWALDAQSLQHSFIPVENTHNLLGSYKNSNSPTKSWKNILFPIVDVHIIWRLFNYSQEHSRADYSDLFKRIIRRTGQNAGPVAFLNQTADATCAMVLRTSLFGFLEFGSASKHSPKLIFLIAQEVGEFGKIRSKLVRWCSVWG